LGSGEAELDRVLRDRPDLAPFLDTGADERFFVKNLERFQGDERDAIILSIGYGKDRAGRLPSRFGPLLGLRRRGHGPRALPSFAQLPRRGPRPNVPERDAIADYSDRELGQVVRWIISDGRLRPQDALVREVATELGFKRLGSRIAEAIEAAIGRVRGSGGTEPRRTA